MLGLVGHSDGEQCAAQGEDGSKEADPVERRVALQRLPMAIGEWPEGKGERKGWRRRQAEAGARSYELFQIFEKKYVYRLNKRLFYS